MVRTKKNGLYGKEDLKKQQTKKTGQIIKDLMNNYPEGKAGLENLSSSSSQRKLNPTAKSLFNWTTDTQKQKLKSPIEAKFSNRRQKLNEPIEVFAAELKKMYAKAQYPSRDENTKREYLLRKFFDGLNDEKIQFQVEYIKEPDNIDDGVFQVVNFCDLNKRSNARAEKRTVRAVTDKQSKQEMRRKSDSQELQ